MILIRRSLLLRLGLYYFSSARKCLCIFHSFITLCNKNVEKWANIQFRDFALKKKNSWIDEQKCKCNILGYRFFYEESVFTFPNVCIFSILNLFQPISLKTLSVQRKISTKYKETKTTSDQWFMRCSFFTPEMLLRSLAILLDIKLKYILVLCRNFSYLYLRCGLMLFSRFIRKTSTHTREYSLFNFIIFLSFHYEREYCISCSGC